MPAASGPIKVKAKRKPVVKPPAGDVASSGGDYGTKKAVEFKRTPQFKRDQKAAAQAGAKQALKALPKPTAKLKHVKGGGPLGTASSVLAASYFPGVTSALAATDRAFGTKTLKFAEKTTGNIPKDAAELAVTTPSSVAKLASTAVHDPAKVPGMLLEFPKQLYHHPLKTISEHPVTTALTVAPAVRAPGLVAGRVARIAGKQTLERPAAALPRTALKDARTGSRDVVVRAAQARKDRKAPAATMTGEQVQRRVDEFYDFGKQHQNRAQASAVKRAKVKAKAEGLPKAERKLKMQDAAQGAHAGARATVDKRFGLEFGSTWRRTPAGVIEKPKNATQGHLHDTRASANAIAKRLNQNPAIIREAGSPAPLEFTVRTAGDKYAVVPKIAAVRLHEHRVVGTSKATMAKVMRRSRQAFTQATLPLSAKWLAGQGVEAGIRSAVAGAGPFDLLRAKKVVARMNAERKGAGDELLMRISGGQFGLTGTAREFANGRSLADEFAGTSLARPARAMSAAGKVKPARALRAGWRGYTSAVLDGINHAIESNARKAMAGQSIRQGPLMERRIVGLSDQALSDAAKGLKGTDAQVRLGREVDRMYGRYQRFSPDTRSLLLHWTPFAPWYINVATFLGKVLPVDHPAKAAMLANVDAVTEDWRKQHGLSLRGGKTRPSFLLGGYPTGKGDQIVRIAHYTPFGVGQDVAGSVSGLMLPQFVGPIKNLAGVDWKWQRLRKPGFKGKELNQGQRAARAGVTILEEQIPGVSQLGNVSGLTPRYIDKKDVPSVVQGKVNKKALLGLVPFAPTATIAPKGSTKDKLSEKYGLGSGSKSVDDLAKKYGLHSGKSIDDLAKKYGVGK